jgi:hypothetical protein
LLRGNERERQIDGQIGLDLGFRTSISRPGPEQTNRQTDK